MAHSSSKNKNDALHLTSDTDYFLPSDLQSFMGKEYDGSLKCFHLNTRSARNKANELDFFFHQFSFDFDIIMLTETWFSDANDVLKLPMYNAFFKPHRKSGGGVALLLRESMSCEMLTDYCCVHQNYEILSVLIGHSIIAVCYRPPAGNISSFFAFLESFLEFANENKYNIILGGDFNINMLLETADKRQMDMLIKAGGCMNTISLATRITNESSTLLDLFITSFAPSQTKSGVVITDISDHLGIFLCVKININKRQNKPAVVKFQNITSDSLDDFRRKLSSMDWSDVLHETDPNKAYNMFLIRFQKLYVSCFPYKSISPSRKIRKP